MRVNMDSSMISDPRFQLVADDLELDIDAVFGKCFRLWLACYERRSVRLSKREADVAARHKGFLDAMVKEGLANLEEGGQVRIHGVEERIRFLVDQAERGRKGGKAKTKRAGVKKKANAKAKAEAVPQANAVANASSNAKAYTPSLALTPARTLADRFKVLIQIRLPTYLHTSKAKWPKTREKWADVFRLAHEQDSRPWDEMEDVLEWSQADDFWQANILSAVKFRQQYDVLLAQKRREQKQTQPVEEHLLPAGRGIGER